MQRVLKCRACLTCESLGEETIGDPAACSVCGSEYLEYMTPPRPLMEAEVAARINRHGIP